MLRPAELAPGQAVLPRGADSTEGGEEAAAAALTALPPSASCRDDACSDVDEDCCAPEGEERGCRLEGYVVTPWHVRTAGQSACYFGPPAVYRCCAVAPPPSPPPPSPSLPPAPSLSPPPSPSPPQLMVVHARSSPAASLAATSAASLSEAQVPSTQQAQDMPSTLRLSTHAGPAREEPLDDESPRGREVLTINGWLVAAALVLVGAAVAVGVRQWQRAAKADTPSVQGRKAATAVADANPGEKRVSSKLSSPIPRLGAGGGARYEQVAPADNPRENPPCDPEHGEWNQWI